MEYVLGTLKIHLQKFHCCTISLPAAAAACTVNKKGKAKAKVAALTVSAQQAVQMLNLPQETVEGIWQKSGQLISDPQALSSIPGGSILDRFVLSTSTSQPHTVKCRSLPDSAECHCDDRCLHFKLIGICSHTVAAAHISGDLERFLKNITKSQ